MVDLNAAVYTVKDVSGKRKNILCVVHDEDGEWQFLPGTDVTPEEIMIVSFQNIIDMDKTIIEIINLPKGFEANRLDENSEWTFKKIVDE